MVVGGSDDLEGAHCNLSAEGRQRLAREPEIRVDLAGARWRLKSQLSFAGMHDPTPVLD